MEMDEAEATKKQFEALNAQLMKLFQEVKDNHKEQSKRSSQTNEPPTEQVSWTQKDVTGEDSKLVKSSIRSSPRRMSSQPTTREEQKRRVLLDLEQVAKITAAEIEDSREGSQERKRYIAENYRLNREALEERRNMTELEKLERRYGILTQGDPDYLNPRLNGFVVEKHFFSPIQLAM